jgi:hypothetical protein
LDGNYPEPSTESDSETALLLADIDSALRMLEAMNEAEDETQRSLSRLELALHTYGSVKHLLPKLNLSASRQALVAKRLQILRTQILAHGLRDRR